MPRLLDLVMVGLPKFPVLAKLLPAPRPFPCWCVPHYASAPALVPLGELARRPQEVAATHPQ